MKKSLSRHSTLALNLTPYYRSNKYAFGGAENVETDMPTTEDASDMFSAYGGTSSVGNAFKYTGKMIDAASKNLMLNSTANIQSGIVDNMSLAYGNQNLNTNDEVMQSWEKYSPMNPISFKDVRGGSTIKRLHNSQMSELRGAEAGYSASGGAWQGAVIGGIAGKILGNLSWSLGNRAAHKIKDKLNAGIEFGNELGYLGNLNQQRNVEARKHMYADSQLAYGGPLDKKLAGHQMQDIYENGTPSANKFAPGGNVAITASPQISSSISSLIPYIQRAKQIREAKEAKEVQAAYNAVQASRTQSPVSIGTEVQIPVQDNRPTFVPPTENTKSEMREYVPSDELIDSILRHEGYLAKPSNKLDGIWTIGYGDTDKELTDYYRAHPNEIFPEAEARKRAADRIRTEFLGYAEKYTPNWDKLTGPQKDAIISYIYNVGPGSFKNKHPKLQKALREMDLEGIAENMSAGYYDKSKPGLKKRRDFERLAFYYPEMTTYGIIPEGVTKRSFEPNNSPANKLRYDALGVKQPKTGNVPAIYTKEYLNTMPDENSLMQRGAAIWGFANGGNLFKGGGPDGDPVYNGGELNPIVVRDRKLTTDNTYSSWVENTENYFTGSKKGLYESQYRPTVGDNGEKYYTREGLKHDVLLNLFGGKNSEDLTKLGDRVFYKDFDDAYLKLSKHNAERTAGNATLGAYGVSAGKDNRGRYISFHDTFDYRVLPMLIGDYLYPFKIYDRIYEDEVKDLYDKIKNNSPYDASMRILKPASGDNKYLGSAFLCGGKLRTKKK